MESSSKKIIAIVGPTASGKSDLAIALARKYDGEIISADSRQVYRGMDIGTGKVPRDFSEKDKRQATRDKDKFLSEGIVHHLIDIADPNDEYNISHFLIDAPKAIEDIRSRGKQPVICGGTHFWIQALLDDTAIPAVPPDPALRARLATHTPEQLFSLLEQKDPTRAASIDRHNKIRLIRALEICATLGAVPSLCHPEQSEGFRTKNEIPRQARNDMIIIALVPDKEILYERIVKRLEKRIAEGMIEEVEHLHTEGVSWERLEAFGLEYRYIALFLQEKITEAAMREELLHAIWHYAKRQLSWLRRWERLGANIRWISDPKEAEEIF